MVALNGKLLAASVLIVVSAMCLFGTSLSLNAERKGDSDTFDVSATFTAVDAEGNSMAGASVYCSSDGGSFSLKGTTNSEGTLSFSESPVTLSSGDCPKKSVTRSCYAQKGEAKTETVSETAELECRSGPASTSMPAQGDRADFDTPSGVPRTMCTGETRTVSLSAKNAGTTTWTTSYRVASTTSYDWAAAPQSLSLGNEISPGYKYTSTVQITAPSSPGTYGFQWEMKNGAGNFFGKPSGFADIKVSACTATPIPGISASCDSSCKSNLGANGGVCASDVSGPRCYEDVEAPVRSVMPTGSNGWVVSWLPSSKSSGFYCGGDSTTKCFCYNLQSCAPYGCKSGTCVAPTACQTKGVTGNAICALRGLNCVSSTCSGGCSDAPAAEGPCGCTATCSSLKAGEVCQKAGQSGSEACAAIGKSCVSSTCGSGTCPNPTRSDAGPCDCTATCR